MKISLPFTKEVLKTLKAGDTVYVSGTLFTARDAAHKRIFESLKKGERLPFSLLGQTIYYAGPCPAKPGRIAGPCGPTTSTRMDRYTPKLLDHGLFAIIGKGNVGDAVAQALVKNGAVYFAAIGGAGALYANAIEDIKTIAYDDLGTESVKRVTVKDMPLIVAIDTQGNNLYKRQNNI